MCCASIAGYTHWGWSEVIRIRDQCKANQVPFFFKQWGGVQKSKYGRTLDGQTYDAMPALTLAQTHA